MSKDKENEAEIIREKAVRLHDREEKRFRQWYELLGVDQYSSEFAYGRKLIIRELEGVVKSVASGSTVLDIGSGTGHLMSWLAEKGLKVIGLEPSTAMRTTCKKLFPHLEVIEGYASNLPFRDGIFDAVVCVEVLRYLHPHDILNTYKEIFRVLKEGGIAFITMVNRWAMDGYLLYYCWKRFIDPEYHYTYFTTAGKEIETLKKCGFKKVQAAGVMYAFIRIFYKAGRRTGAFLTRLIEFINREQRWEKEPWRSLAGSLILIAQK